MRVRICVCSARCQMSNVRRPSSGETSMHADKNSKTDFRTWGSTMPALPYQRTMPPLSSLRYAHKVSEYTPGQPVAVMFFTTWSNFCKEGAAVFVNLSQKYRRVYFVAVTRERRAVIIDNNDSFRQLSEMNVASDHQRLFHYFLHTWGLMSVPTGVIFSPEGVMIFNSHVMDPRFASALLRCNGESDRPRRSESQAYRRSISPQPVFSEPINAADTAVLEDRLKDQAHIIRYLRYSPLPAERRSLSPPPRPLRRFERAPSPSPYIPSNPVKDRDKVENLFSLTKRYLATYRPDRAAPGH